VLQRGVSKRIVPMKKLLTLLLVGGLLGLTTGCPSPSSGTGSGTRPGEKRTTTTEQRKTNGEHKKTTTTEEKIGDGTEKKTTTEEKKNK
jgi:hypothetical protein